jgi:hypothetical protein
MAGHTSYSKVHAGDCRLVSPFFWGGEALNDVPMKYELSGMTHMNPEHEKSEVC